MYFKIGDDVRIRKHTAEDKQQYYLGWACQMDEFEGKIGTLTDVGLTAYNERVWQITIGDKSHWFWERSFSLVDYNIF